MRASTFVQVVSPGQSEQVDVRLLVRLSRMRSDMLASGTTTCFLNSHEEIYVNLVCNDLWA
jgi:hypothetical protein